MIDVPPVAKELGARFAEAGQELYLVGGSVRDILQSRPSPDLDFATSAHPTETTRLLRGWADRKYLVGVRFGTVGALKDGVRIEITTFRKEIYAEEHRKPAVTFGDDILVDRGDAAARLRDGIYVLRIEGALVVKRLALNPAARSLSIRSDNPAYPGWPDCAPAAVDVVGRVVWAGRRLG